MKKTTTNKTGIHFTRYLHLVLTILLSIVYSEVLLAQSAVNYTFTTSITGSLATDLNGNIIDMTTGTAQLVGPGLDAAESSLTNIGFDFFFMGTRQTQFAINDDGQLQLGNTPGTNKYSLVDGTAAAPKLAAFNADLRTGTTTGKVHYKLIGTAPNRTLVVEYRDMQLFYTGTAGVGTSTWQVRLYEASGAVEYVYGNMSASDVATGNKSPSIGFYSAGTTGKFASVLYATHTVSTTSPYAANPAVTATGAITALTSAADGSRRTYLFSPASVTAPSALAFTAVNGTGMTLNWADNAATPNNEIGYVIYRSTDNINFSYITTTTADAVSYNATGLTFATNYYWRIYALRETLSTPVLSGAQATPGIISAQSGPWEAPATWVGGVVPACTDNAGIQAGHVVTVNIAAANAANVAIYAGGTLNISGNSLTLGCTANNNTLFVNGGTLNVSAGSLLINGNIAVTNGSTFSQSGGNIVIDGNGGGIAASSVASGTPLLAFGSTGTSISTGTISLTGGTITIVDPHAATTNTNGYAVYGNLASGVNFNASITHILQFGNGISSDAGGNTSGFYYNLFAGSGRLNLGSVIVNNTSGANRNVTQTATNVINGDLTITAGTYSQGTSTTNIGSNISVGNTGTLLAGGTFVFASTTGTTTSAQTIAQNISIAPGGAINNLAASPTANFTSVTINNTSSTGVTFNSLNAIPGNPASASSASGTLTFTAGKITTAPGSTFILGTSAPAGGTLSYTAGGFTSGSTFGRWWTATATGSTIAASTDPTATAGRYPFINANSQMRSAFIERTAPSAAGIYAITYNNLTGTTPVSFIDGAYTVTTMANDNWTVSTLGTSPAAGSNELAILTPSLFTVAAPNFRLVQSAGIIGTHQTGTTTPCGQRVLSTAELVSGAFYLGINDAEVPFTTVMSGDWGNPATWNKGTVPTITDDVVISAGHAVTIGVGTNTARSLLINNTGTLSANANILTIDSTILNNGTLNIGGGTCMINGGVSTNGIINAAGSTFNLTTGTLNIGPAGGGNKRFTTNGGISTVSGGNLMINGNFVTNGGSFNQTGGTITVDGNSGTVATSVPSGTHLVTLTSPGTTHNFTGGTIIVVDPPHDSYTATSTRSINISATSTSVIFGGTHTIQLGDGVSTTTGNVSGFAVETYASSVTPINNLVINGGSGTGRWGSGSYNNATNFGTHIKGNLVINIGSEFRTTPVADNSINFAIGGNIINDGILTTMSATAAASAITMGSMTGFTASVQQSISGTGIFRNNTTGSTGNFRSITVNNPIGLDLSTIGNVTYTGTVTFTKGKIFMGGNIMIQPPGANIAGNSTTTGWVVGKLQKNATTGAISHTYPVGDANYYAPVTIVGSAGAVTTAGNLVVNTTPGDHPIIAGSGVSSTKGVNRYYTITTDGTIAFAPGSLTVTLNWDPADVDAGATTANFIAGKYDAGTWTNPPVASPNATAILVTGVSSFSDFIVGQAFNPLTVKLDNISATNVNTRNRVDWNTRSENNGDLFTIERSTDGRSFTQIGTVPAKGMAANYSYWDMTPAKGINYYRLKMNDANSKVSYSRVVNATVNMNTSFGIEAFPNPVADFVTVNIHGTKADNATITVTDITGKIMATVPVNSDNVKINMGNMTQGIYFINYTDNNNNHTIKLTKQ